MARVLARFPADARRVSNPGAPVLAVERRFERNVHELLAGHADVPRHDAGRVSDANVAVVLRGQRCWTGDCRTSPEL